MTLYAIDPGPEQSGICVFSGSQVKRAGHLRNESVLKDLQDGDELLIEAVQCYGKPVGKSIFNTAIWLGRFIQQAKQNEMAVYVMPYREVQRQTGAKDDGGIATYLKLRLGTSWEMLHGKQHAQSAVALALVFLDQARVFQRQYEIQ